VLRLSSCSAQAKEADSQRSRALRGAGLKLNGRRGMTCSLRARGEIEEDCHEVEDRPDGLTTEDGAYSIKVTPYDGELVGGEPTGNPGAGLTVNFFVPEPSRWLLLAAGLVCLVVLHRVRGLRLH
jgi:hypothetical protein